METSLETVQLDLSRAQARRDEVAVRLNDLQAELHAWESEATILQYVLDGPIIQTIRRLAPPSRQERDSRRDSGLEVEDARSAEAALQQNNMTLAQTLGEEMQKSTAMGAELVWDNVTADLNEVLQKMTGVEAQALTIKEEPEALEIRIGHLQKGIVVKEAVIDLGLSNLETIYGRQTEG